ncbi:MAG: biotin--[acetyl-CoA-carboxylase] ligase [Ruminococcus sp.]|jgi:BirA family biotin operon repressor/biotin-[acetyl-CoA-carboxylase] ligase|nr:biotin--[acetyl-CoA-carboxylase] ligase [Ruminococcus sp.]
MNPREEILRILTAHRGETVTGNDLGDALGISRSAVWRHVKVLRAKGYQIYSRTNSGYCLEGKQDILSAADIIPKLSGSLGRDIDIYKTIDSTNTFAKSLAVLGAKHGKTIIADSQGIGRGQTGHDFYSPAGSSIYMSVIIRPKFLAEDTMLITTATAVAVTDAISEVCGINTGIKWVNDIYTKGTSRKLCGILAEASFGMETSQIEYTVIGIGVNVNNTSFPTELKNTATSLYLETGRFFDRNLLIAKILDALDRRIAQIPSAAFLEEYRRLSILIGKKVNVTHGNRTFTAKVLEIDSLGRLVVKPENAPVSVLSSGSVALIG